MHVSASAIPHFGGTSLVCTAFAGKLGKGLTHVLGSHATDPLLVGFRYVVVKHTEGPKANQVRR